MKHRISFARAVTTGAMAMAVAAGSACTMKSQEAPPITGPSSFATSVTVAPSPDILTQDGASQSVVTVTARDANGQPLRNVSMRAEISVGGITADHGTLSARNIVTGSDGRATLVYTAPVLVPGATATSLGVDIAVTPIGTDYNNSQTSYATIRLVPPGNTPLPSGLDPRFTFSPTAPAEFQSVMFDASASTSLATNPIASYSWDFGDGSTGSGRTATHAYTKPGTYFVRLTISDTLGRSASTTQTLTVGQAAAPTANFVFSPTDPKANQSINFNASASTAASGRRIVSYTWDYGDGSPIDTHTSPITSHTYGTARTYTVTLVVTDDIGRTSTRSTTVTVAQ
jgi:chitodextrinase